jgi:WD repeat-containing protein 35
LISCNSGKILRYTLPHLGNPDRINTPNKLIKCGSCKNANYIWGIDEQNILSIWECEKSTNSNSNQNSGKGIKPKKLDFQRKDVWQVIWSNEESLKFCFMEKNRLFIIKDLEPEEPLICNGYIADFSQLEITAIMLEDLMVRPWETNFNPNDIVIKFETRILRDLREMFDNNIDMNDIYLYIERNSHQKLWELLAKYSLLNLDFNSSEKAMIQYNDYMGLNFIKRVKMIDDDNIKKAEIYQFFLEYEKAEETYNEIDRCDLSISMRIKLGHWENVINLINESGYVQEDNLKMAKNNMALQYMEKKQYDKSEELFKETHNTEGLVNLYFKSENYEKAIPYIESIPPSSEFLNHMADKFETVNKFLLKFFYLILFHKILF